MTRTVMVVTIAVTVLACAAHAETLRDKLFDAQHWEASIVQAIAPQTGTGGCVSFRVLEYGAAGGWLDAGLLKYDEAGDPFIGASTNIAPLDQWTQAQASLSTRWGAGYLFGSRAMFYYTRLTLKF